MWFIPSTDAERVALVRIPIAMVMFGLAWYVAQFSTPDMPILTVKIAMISLFGGLGGVLLKQQYEHSGFVAPLAGVIGR